MDEYIQWAMGIAVSILVAAFARVEVSMRNLATGNSKTNERLDVHKTTTVALISDVKDRYVRRDDLDRHIARIDIGLRDLREENRQFNKQVLAELSRLRGEH